MFKRKKKKTGCETPEYRCLTMPPVKPPKPPTSGSNAFKSSPVTILSNNIGTVEIICHYETPCGWCAKWDKKCDKKIGGGNDIEPRREKDTTLEYIKSGKGLPPLNTKDTYGLETRG